MDPSNPTNNQPFIYRFVDSEGNVHQVVPVDHTHNNLVGQTISFWVNGTEIKISANDVPNFLRAISDPDSTPTASSDKLVTSGGVKIALDAKMNNRSFDSTPTQGSSNLVTSGSIYNYFNANGKLHWQNENNNMGPVAIENIVGFPVEEHVLLNITNNRVIPVKNIWNSNAGTMYYDDRLGSISSSRWVIVSIKQGTYGASKIYAVTLEAEITPT